MKMRIVLLALISFCFLSVNAADKKKNQPVNDRTQWVDLCYKIAQPVLENMSKGELQKNMQLELRGTEETSGWLIWKHSVGSWQAFLPGWSCLMMIRQKESNASKYVSGL